MPTTRKRKNQAPELPPLKKKKRLKGKSETSVKRLIFIWCALFGCAIIFMIQKGDIDLSVLSTQTEKLSTKIKTNKLSEAFGHGVILKDTYLRQNMLADSPILAQLYLGQEVNVLGKDAAWALIETEDQKGYVAIEALMIEQ